MLLQCKRTANKYLKRLCSSRQSEAYSELNQISKMQGFPKITNCFLPLAIFVKSSILDVWLRSECISDNWPENFRKINSFIYYCIRQIILIKRFQKYEWARKCFTAQKMNFSITDFFSERDQTRSFLVSVSVLNLCFAWEEIWKTSRYSRRMRFIFDNKQHHSLSSITCGSNFVSALNDEKNKYSINTKDHIKRYRS